MRRHWKLLTILAAAAITGLALVAIASAATPTPKASTAPGAADARGVCGALTDDPEALAELQALRAEKREAWQAWFEQWGDDRRSDEAQAALQELRETYWDKMRALLEKYDIAVPQGAGPCTRSGQGGGMMRGGGGCGGCAGWDGQGAGAQGRGMMGGGMMGGGVSY